MLKFGSIGSDVRRLQYALNLDPGGETLVTDGMFGIRTDGRVKQFQGAKGTFQDGIVGPLTLALLQPLFDLLDHVDKRPVTTHEQLMRNRIRSQALAFEAAWGWNDANKLPSDQNRILLRRLVNSTTRQRFGGLSLLVILLGGGAGAGYQLRAPKIPANMAVGELSVDAVEDEKKYSEKRNSEDILSWCGVFALCVVRSAGFKADDWSTSGGITSQVAGKNEGVEKTYPFRKVSPADLNVGDIGVIEPSGRNHHFIVVGRNGHILETVDGNAGFFHSIVRKQYSLVKSKSTNAKDLTPLHAGKGQPENAVLLSLFPQSLPGKPGGPGFEPAGQG